MATLQASSALGSPMNVKHGVYDMNEFEKFINFDNALNPTPSLSPGAGHLKQTMPSEPIVAPAFTPPTSQSPQSHQPTFSGPSHNYDLYRQQTGLPTGSLASTIAVNQASNMHYNYNSGFVMPDEPVYQANRTQDYVNFGAPMPRRESDMEMSEFSYVNPTIVASQESQQHQVMMPSNGRMYPGMHQQQAALAKARAQQQESIRQHQQQQQQQQQQHQQQQQQRQAAAAQQAARGQHDSDPFFEESISRVLHDMRQASVVSQDDESSDVLKDLQSSLLRRKDEEDMDADEKLLASEEGKKLSSKERRQLRNKVSARAFRSRRKEYISQLEGEIAAKTTEASDLRQQNRLLMEENARLTEMSRMFLQTPQFAQMLEQMGVNGNNSGVSSSPMVVPSSGSMYN